MARASTRGLNLKQFKVSFYKSILIHARTVVKLRSQKANEHFVRFISHFAEGN